MENYEVSGGLRLVQRSGNSIDLMSNGEIRIFTGSDASGKPQPTGSNPGSVLWALLFLGSFLLADACLSFLAGRLC